MVRKALERDLQILKNLLIDMAKAVNDMISGAMLSFEKLDAKMAERIINYDDQVDYYEHMVTLTALEVMALQQPVAKDLRFIVSTVDIARNLERLADQAVNIAERVPNLIEYKESMASFCKIDILNMAKEALFMLEEAINAFLSEDVPKAQRVIQHDDIVDQFKRDYLAQIRECMKGDLSFVDAGIEYIIIVQNLERVADHACNIAESVIFTVQGKIPKLERTPLVREIIARELPVFNLLLRHARLVIECCSRVPLALEAYYKGDTERFKEISQHIIDIEKEADKVKTNIRGHLPKGMILPVEKFELFLYLKEQDAVADVAEKILNWLSFKRVPLTTNLYQKLETLLNQSLEPLRYFEEIIDYSADFLISWDENSRNRAKELIRKVRYHEFLTEEMGNQLKRFLFESVSDTFALFYILRLIELICEVSQHAENAGDLMRAMIAK
ncbi:MAG: phosphate signaling complex protein PhoU [Caldimicrobium sp.]|nr:phosphate signaling complex protein PhoU [Caldimicrobium sp.]MCX7873919.1 phosphate signaling complex protein PhoU [Caldimicrobium sp.]MDW8094288.1 phosphate signaling complex protein PhoU [Caldimicrobium sp.]